MSLHNEIDMSELYNANKDQRQLLSRLIKSLQKLNRQEAKAEHDYRLAYTKTVMKMNTYGFEGELDGKNYATDSIAWTAAIRIAKGVPDVAEKRERRDLIKGEKEAVMQKIYQTKLEIGSLEKEIEAINRAD